MRLSISILALSLALPSLAAAQSAPPDGLYEDFPSIFMEPSVPLTAAPTLLPRWVDVHTSAGLTTVTFMPDARIVWHITWGAHGPDEKVTLVDGEEWTRSRFTYDAAGYLASKQVTGRGAEGGLTYTYATDAAGAIRSRTTTLPSAGASVVERVDVTRTPSDVTVTLRRARLTLRTDRYDAQHRLLETHLFDANGTEVASLTYRRDRQGSSRWIRRRIGSHRGTADPTHPDTTLIASDVLAVSFAPLELHEVRLLLGAPTMMTDEGRGLARTIHAELAPSGCWLDQVSGLDFDATGLSIHGTVGCICGFCVAASVALGDGERAHALGIEEHWTAGPWVRIDGTIDVTIDHELVTPEGARRAGSLAVGDIVLTAAGSPHAIVSIERLEDDTPRLGVNLRTAEGVFSAGGLLFVSETESSCTP